MNIINVVTSNINILTTKVSCGKVANIPAKIPNLVADIILILQIAVPIILVIYGSIDLVKGVMAGKEDEIKKGQQIFIKRLITAAIVFFVVVIVKFVVSIISDADETNGIIECVDCFVSKDCKKQDTK